MIKSILIQLWNERKSVILIWVELLVVSVLMWYLADALYLQYKQYTSPIGINIDHVYHVQLGTVPVGSADYDTTTVHGSEGGSDILIAYDRITHNPNVSVACFTMTIAFPYMWNNRFATFKRDTIIRNGFVRYVQPSYYRVFRVMEAGGGSPEVLEKAAMENNCIVTANVAKDFFGSAKKASHKQLAITDQGTVDSVMCNIGAVCNPMRYNEFDEYNYVYYKPIKIDEIRTVNADAVGWLPIFIRVKASADNSSFAENFRHDMAQQLRVGNIYLKDVIPMSYYRNEMLREKVEQAKGYITVIFFFLINVLLGIVGTFWFRTQQRHSEMGLRMAMGASRYSIFGSLLGEGLLLLATAMIPTIFIIFNMAKLDVMQITPIPVALGGRIIFAFLFTLGVEAAMILIGISFPAWKAMHLHPADVLHEE